MKQIILILSLIFLAGCSATPFDDGVIRTEDGTPILDGEQLKTSLAQTTLGMMLGVDLK